MRKLTLELNTRKNPDAGEVLLHLFGESQTLQRVILERAFKVFRPRALDFIQGINESRSLDAEPHELYFDYQTSFVDTDFEVGEELTLLGKYLHLSDGYILSEAESWNLVLRNLPDKPYWSPEWPKPLRIKLGWEVSKPPFELTVVCAADSDEQMAHLLTHNHLDDILNGMLPIIEEFLNRKVEFILKMDPSDFD